MREKVTDVKLGEAGLPHKLAYEPALWLARRLWVARPTGLENIPQDGPYILAPNHASFLDGPILLNAMGKCRPTREDMSFVVWSGTAKQSRFVKFAFEAINAILADDSTGSPATLRKCIKWLDSGKYLTIFPEGKRTLDGKLNEFIAGVGFIACKAGVPVIPVAMKGMFEMYPPGKILPKFVDNWHRPRVDVNFLKPIYPQEYNARTLTAAVEQAVRDALGPGETARI